MLQLEKVTEHTSVKMIIRKTCEQRRADGKMSMAAPVPVPSVQANSFVCAGYQLLITGVTGDTYTYERALHNLRTQVATSA